MSKKEFVFEKSIGLITSEYIRYTFKFKKNERATKTVANVFELIYPNSTDAMKARRVSEWIHDNFEYSMVKRVSNVGDYSTIRTMFKTRCGVCRDFALLAIKILQEWGVEATYVGLKITSFFGSKTLHHAVFRVNGKIYDPTRRIEYSTLRRRTEIRLEYTSEQLFPEACRYDYVN